MKTENTVVAVDGDGDEVEEREAELHNVNFFYTDHFCPTKFTPRKST